MPYGITYEDVCRTLEISLGLQLVLVTSKSLVMQLTALMVYSVCGSRVHLNVCTGCQIIVILLAQVRRLRPKKLQ